MHANRFVVIFGFVAVMGYAQELAPVPKAEVFGTYSYFRTGQSSGYGAADVTKGLGVAGAININRWLGLMVDTGHHFGEQPISPDNGLHVNYTLHTLMGGPRLTYRHNDKFTPYADI